MAIRTIKREVNKKKGDKSSAAYSEKQRMEAVAMYMIVGKFPLVSATTGIPLDRLRHWKQQDWWKDMEEEIRRSRNIEVSGKIQRVVDKVFNLLEDRVDNGDYLYDPKTSKFVRRPISAKTANDIMTKALDRELVLQKLQDAPQVQEEAILDRLKSIEATLIRASQMKKIEIIDADYVSDREYIDGTPVSTAPESTPDNHSSEV